MVVINNNDIIANRLDTCNFRLFKESTQLNSEYKLGIVKLPSALMCRQVNPHVFISRILSTKYLLGVIQLLLQIQSKGFRNSWSRV